jgi:ribosomal-protein-alanine N-acetyltransferase
MKLLVNDRVVLTDLRPSDKAAFIAYLNDREIYDHTFRIPFPYTEADADQWLAHVARTTEEQGQPVHWAIRDDQNSLIGAFGFNDIRLGGGCHRAEIGYWLARPFWGRGIMTAVVRRACDFAVRDWGLVKIVAHVFAHNPASARVLEKCGFQQEGYLKKHFLKDGRFIDARFYALVSDPAAA